MNDITSTIVKRNAESGHDSASELGYHSSRRVKETHVLFPGEASKFLSHCVWRWSTLCFSENGRSTLSCVMSSMGNLVG